MKFNFEKVKKVIAGASLVASSVGDLKAQDIESDIKDNNFNSTEMNGNYYDKKLKNNNELDKFKNEAFKYKDYGMFMSCNIASEKPTEHQIKSLKDLEDEIILNINNKKFESISDLILSINNSIKNNENNFNTIYIKDAFPEKEGAKSKGSFDCDSRAVICLSILERIGISGDDVSMCLIKGHAFLKIKDNLGDKFFETTTNKFFELNESQKVQIDEIDSFDKYYSYLLGKEASQLISDADINILDNNKMSLAFGKLEESVQLDKNNLTNNLNFLYVLKKIKNKDSIKNLSSTISDNIIKTIVGNFYGVNGNDFKNENLVVTPEEVSTGKIKPKSLEDLGDIKDLIIESIKSNDYIKKEFSDLASSLFNNFENYDKALELYQNLSKSTYDSKAKVFDKNYGLYKSMEAQCFLKKKMFDEYRREVQGNLYDFLSSHVNDKEIGSYCMDIINEQNLNITALDIITGKVLVNESTIANFCEKYKYDQLIGPYISGDKKFNSNSMEANRLLEEWPGYSNMIDLINNWRKSNK